MGDFNGDGQADILVRSSWGIGLLSRTGSGGTFETLDLRSYSGSFGNWNLNNTDTVEAIGDFNGDGRDEFIIRSGWGIGIIGIPSSASRLTLPNSGVPHNTTISSIWTLKQSDEFIGSGKFQWGTGFNPTKDGILIKSDQSGIAVLNFTTSGSNPYIFSAQHFNNSDWIYGVSGWGSWHFNAPDNTVNPASIGDGFDGFVIRSDWGAAVIARTAGSAMLEVHAVYRDNCQGTLDYDACHEELGGGWLFNSNDHVVPAGTVEAADGHDYLLMKRFVN